MDKTQGRENRDVGRTSELKQTKDRKLKNSERSCEYWLRAWVRKEQVKRQRVQKLI